MMCCCGKRKCTGWILKLIRLCSTFCNTRCVEHLKSFQCLDKVDVFDDWGAAAQLTVALKWTREAPGRR